MQSTYYRRTCLTLGAGLLLLTAGLTACGSGTANAPGSTGSTDSGGVTGNTDPETGLVYNSFITITKGGTYSGNWQNLTDPSKPAISVETSEPVIIENSNIRSVGPLIRSRYKNADLTVRNTHGVALNPGVAENLRSPPRYFLHLENFQNAVIENNEMDGTAGMYFFKFQGDAAKGQTIKILRNKALNIDGRSSNGPDTYSATEYYRVQFTQFNAVQNMVGAEIAWNEIINEPGKSRVEENINMYASSGTPQSTIDIHDNYIQGAYPADPVAASYAGGGIMLGDGRVGNALDEAASYLRAYNNQVVSTSNQGITISAGHDNEAYNNRVISSGLLPDGRNIGSQNVGLVVWDMHGDKATNAFYNNAMYNNEVGWAKALTANPTLPYPDQRPFWFPDCPPVDSLINCKNNKVLPGPITLAMEQQELVRWQSKLSDNKVQIGPQN